MTKLFRSILLVLFFTSFPAISGTIAIEWSLVEHPDLAGYRVVWGTTPGVWDHFDNIGSPTQQGYIVSELEDCVTHYVTVRSLDVDGNESADSPSIVEGWPKVDLSEVIMGEDSEGGSAMVRANGSNFDEGSVVFVDDVIVTVLEIECASITIEPTSGLELCVYNGDLTYDCYRVDLFSPRRVNRVDTTELPEGG